MTTITICSSASFYKQVIDVRGQLLAIGYAVLIPENAETMEANNDFDVTHYKTWYENADDYNKKADLIRGHFTEIAKGDAVLIVNSKKHGLNNYIGGNVLMEMAIAFYLHKPIFLLNDVPAESAYEEEIRGLGSVPLQGNLAKITELLARS